MPYGTGIYAPSCTRATYAELLRRAAELLVHGESVIADASWVSAEHRAAAAVAARDADARLVPLRCTAPADLAALRTSHRREGISDADRQIARQMTAATAPWPGAITIDTGSGGTGGASEPDGMPGDLICQALEAIRPQRPGYAPLPVRPYMPPG